MPTDVDEVDPPLIILISMQIEGLPHRAATGARAHFIFDTQGGIPYILNFDPFGHA
jgi:hypothetical protein